HGCGIRLECAAVPACVAVLLDRSPPPRRSLDPGALYDRSSPGNRQLLRETQSACAQCGVPQRASRLSLGSMESAPENPRILARVLRFAQDHQLVVETVARIHF